MAGRPTKQGIDYFHFDVGFFEDIKVRKIIKACGSNAPSILLHLVCYIYKDYGYFLCWDEDTVFLTAEKFGCSEGLVSEVVCQALRVGFFNPELHAQYGVLTSRGVQKRYFRVVKDAKRASVEVDSDILLVDIDKFEFPEGVISDRNLINPSGNSITASGNSINPTDNRQSKVKKSKVNQSKVNKSKVKKREADKPPAPSKPSKRFVPPTIEEVIDYCNERKSDVDPLKFFDYFMASDWVDSRGQKVKNWKQKAISWEGRGSSLRGKSASTGNPFFDMNFDDEREAATYD